MAAIDKIYGTVEQYDAFRTWIEKHKPEYLRYFYPRPESDGKAPITNLPGTADIWVYENCPFPFVREAIEYQYNGKPNN